jgi:hypothetical protein
MGHCLSYYIAVAVVEHMLWQGTLDIRLRRHQGQRLLRIGRSWLKQHTFTGRVAFPEVPYVAFYGHGEVNFRLLRPVLFSKKCVLLSAFCVGGFSHASVREIFSSKIQRLPMMMMRCHFRNISTCSVAFTTTTTYRYFKQKSEVSSSCRGAVPGVM